MLNFLKGVCGPNELTRIISRLLALDAHPLPKLERTRWIISEGSVKRLFKTAKRLLKAEPAVIQIQGGPVVIVGDIHGDLKTLLRILRDNGMPPKTAYAFLGDFVDRGANGMEVLLLVLALKCLHPRHVTVLRGNHETAMMTRIYGFMRECLTRYSIHMYTDAVKVFNVMPLAAVFAGRVFLVHGGLSPQLQTLADIEAVQRPAVVVPETLIADLLWSDPSLCPGCEGYSESKRGAGYCFGRSACEAFLERNGLELMVRAHETCYRGTRLHFGRCWTVFSQPQFCGGANAGGVIVVDADCRVATQMYGGDGADLTPHGSWPTCAEDEQGCPEGCSDVESVVDVLEMKADAQPPVYIVPPDVPVALPPAVH